MRSTATSQHPQFRFARCTAAIAMLVLVVSSLVVSRGVAQTAQKVQSATPDDIKKSSALLSEFGELFKKIQDGIQSPEPRKQSRLLPLLPADTVVYAAMPNFGEASHQALEIFQQELKSNADLRKWWSEGDLASNGPKMEDSIVKLYQLSQYVGDEIVIAGSLGQKDGKPSPSFVLITEAKKPGLKNLLLETAKANISGAPPIRVFDVADLATAKDGSVSQLAVLVRPDFVIAASDMTTLRNFNARLEAKHHDFDATPFGQRMTKAYENGVTVVAGADLQPMLKLIPAGDKMQTFQRTGFGDMKYLVWQHNYFAGKSSSEVELSFTGPRHGVASWLAAPAPMGSLDFVSPKAMFALSVLLKNPAEIFDDIKDLASQSNHNAFDGVTQMENALNVNIKDDLLGRLSGEITLEVDSLTQSKPEWKVILRAKDAAALQATLSTLLAATPLKASQTEEKGVTYHAIPVPAGPNVLEINYAFVNGYLLVASSHDTLANALRLQRSGESLAKSVKFQNALPGKSPEVSGLLYEDPNGVAAMTMSRLMPSLADSLSKTKVDAPPIMVSVYGERSAIREVSHSSGFDAGAMMAVAAIAIPNLLKARVAANEGTAAASIRTVNTAQVIYLNSYPAKGYARDLASLGPDPQGGTASSPEHASLVDAALGAASCTNDAWCIKSGFKFRITAQCGFGTCRNYVVAAIPEMPSAGSRSYCSTKDGVVRSAASSPMPTERLSPKECSTWEPVR